MRTTPGPADLTAKYRALRSRKLKSVCPSELGRARMAKESDKETSRSSNAIVAWWARPVASELHDDLDASTALTSTMAISGLAQLFADYMKCGRGWARIIFLFREYNIAPI